MIKQVIVVRKDLNMRRGKESAQCCHASNSFLIEFIHGKSPTKEQISWLNDNFTKVVVSVDSEKELLEIYELAKIDNLTTHLIVDDGKTEFHGMKTATCLAIGPHEAAKIDKVTGHLKLR